uniref:Uncharacterized protein n=1 Tax=Arundo donax TaxID=35708 RepID=A0A0A9FLD7_ARUDO
MEKTVRNIGNLVFMLRSELKNGRYLFTDTLFRNNVFQKLYLKILGTISHNHMKIT